VEKKDEKTVRLPEKPRPMKKTEPEKKKPDPKKETQERKESAPNGTERGSRLTGRGGHGVGVSGDGERFRRASRGRLLSYYLALDEARIGDRWVLPGSHWGCPPSATVDSSSP
jgi:hypothetical protein